jgi:hypothetical protein
VSHHLFLQEMMRAQNAEPMLGKPGVFVPQQAKTDPESQQQYFVNSLA